MIEPCRFVYSLLSDKDQDYMVHLTLIYPSRHHRHEPFLQILVESHLFLCVALHIHRERHLEDIVTAMVPWWQMLQVEAERVEVGKAVGIDYLPHVVEDNGFLLRHLLPQRVDLPVADRLPELCSVALIARRFPKLCTHGYQVAPEVDMILKIHLYLLRRGIRLPPVLLVLLAASVFRRLFLLLLFGGIGFFIAHG